MSPSKQAKKIPVKRDNLSNSPTKIELMQVNGVAVSISSKDENITKFARSMILNLARAEAAATTGARKNFEKLCKTVAFLENYASINDSKITAIRANLSAMNYNVLAHSIETRNRLRSIRALLVLIVSFLAAIVYAALTQ